VNAGVLQEKTMRAFCPPRRAIAISYQPSSTTHAVWYASASLSLLDIFIAIAFYSLAFIDAI
jgi:hypothetical protein